MESFQETLRRPQSLITRILCLVIVMSAAVFTATCHFAIGGEIGMGAVVRYDNGIADGAAPADGAPAASGILDTPGTPDAPGAEAGDYLSAGLTQTGYAEHPISAESPTDELFGPPMPALPPLNYEEIQAAVERIAQEYGATAVSVAIVRNGSVAGTFVYGYATKGTVPLTDEGVFRVASISKPVIGMVVMRLVELGEIGLDTDISEYWGEPVRNPAYPDVPITIRQMLNHTSSFHPFIYGFSASEERIRTRIRNGTAFDAVIPGAFESFAYNNYAYAVLGLTIELATNETVNNHARRHLFEPFGIDAAFGGGALLNTDNLVTLYRHTGVIGMSAGDNRNRLGSTFPGQCGIEFAGGLTINAPDLAILIAALANGGEYRGIRILSEDSVRQMQEVLGAVRGFEQCLALRRVEAHFGEEVLYFHTGTSFGVFTLASYNPHNRNGVVVLTSGAYGRRTYAGITYICAKISEFIYRAMREAAVEYSQ
ncbi:MAG: beta-lactamase family protein [Oscillospiraceae bacterium]|nr:beta-lactamase family protein [Oscillospiraceae bacterium]